jgi:hypothetical protein
MDLGVSELSVTIWNRLLKTHFRKKRKRKRISIFGQHSILSFSLRETIHHRWMTKTGMAPPAIGANDKNAFRKTLMKKTKNSVVVA